MIDYKCGDCGAKQCKLWRQAHVFADAVRLTCWRCLEAKGHEIEYGKPRGSDQVYNSKIEHENWVPAVPDLDGSWWGYTSVPTWWVEWWKHLPDHRDDCKLCRGIGLTGNYMCYRCEGSGKDNQAEAAAVTVIMACQKDLMKHMVE